MTQGARATEAQRPWRQWVLQEVSNQGDALVIDGLLGPFGLFLGEEGGCCECSAGDALGLGLGREREGLGDCF